MSDVTRLLQAIERGDSKASEDLLPVVYEELRRLARAHMANEAPQHTLQATALVHEAYLRLVLDQNASWNGRRHFFGAAAEAMRRILIENARSKNRMKRGRNRPRVELDEACLVSDAPSVDLLALNEALENLAIESPLRADFVKLRYFAGLTIEEAAAAMNISPATAERYWTYSRAWLYHALAQTDESSDPTDGQMSH